MNYEETKDFKCEASGPGKAVRERASKKLEPQEEGGQRMQSAVTKASVASLRERETVAPATTDLETERRKF